MSTILFSGLRNCRALRWRALHMAFGERWFCAKEAGLVLSCSGEQAANELRCLISHYNNRNGTPRVLEREQIGEGRVWRTRYRFLKHRTEVQQ